VLPHCTAVGKALLANLPDNEVRALLHRTGLPARTAGTITDPDRLLSHLTLVRGRGYAVDDGEQETGVRCLGVALPGARAPMAVSVSGPSGRITDDAILRLVPELQRVAGEMGRALSAEPGQPQG
jgi:IclR family transcriptional regulator, acetate operon repressor